jgi:hypothetical protein
MVNNQDFPTRRPRESDGDRISDLGEDYCVCAVAWAYFGAGSAIFGRAVPSGVQGEERLGRESLYSAEDFLIVCVSACDMAPAFKRAFLIFFFGDVLFSLFIFIFIQRLKFEVMLFHKNIYSSGSDLLLLILRNFLRGFENVLPAFF